MWKCLDQFWTYDSMYINTGCLTMQIDITKLLVLYKGWTAQKRPLQTASTIMQEVVLSPNGHTGEWVRRPQKQGSERKKEGERERNNKKEAISLVFRQTWHVQHDNTVLKWHASFKGKASTRLTETRSFMGPFLRQRAPPLYKLFMVKFTQQLCVCLPSNADGQQPLVD